MNRNVMHGITSSAKMTRRDSQIHYVTLNGAHVVYQSRENDITYRDRIINGGFLFLKDHRIYVERPYLERRRALSSFAEIVREIIDNDDR